MSITGNLTASLTTSVSGGNDLGDFAAKMASVQGQEAAVDAAGLREAIADENKEEAVEVDPQEAAAMRQTMASKSDKADKTEKSFRDSVKAAAKALASGEKDKKQVSTENNARSLSHRTRDGLKEKQLMELLGQLGGKGGREALALVKKSVGDKPGNENLIYEAMGFLASAADGEQAKSINAERDRYFAKNEHAIEDQAVLLVAQFGQEMGLGEAKTIHSKIMNVMEEKRTAPEVYASLEKEHGANLNSMMHSIQDLLKMMGTMTKDSNIDHIALIQLNVGIKLLQASMQVPAQISKMKPQMDVEIKHLPNAAAAAT